VVRLTYHEVLTTNSRGSSRRAPPARRKESALGGTTLGVCTIWSRAVHLPGVWQRRRRIGNRSRHMPDKGWSTPFLESLGRASRASWVQLAQRPLGLYRRALGGRAQRSVLSRASTVHRPSWLAPPASAPNLLAGDKRLLSGLPVPRPARPTVKSHSRRARGSTTSALPQQAPLFFAHSTHTQHPWKVIPRALRANYDHQPGPAAVPYWRQRTARRRCIR
jgi:hypothetical protein